MRKTRVTQNLKKGRISKRVLMKSAVQRDILRTLKLTIRYLEEGSHYMLAELSDHTIHNASVFQDEDSISIAVILYALSKIIRRDRKISRSVIASLARAKDYLSRKEMVKYSAEIRELTKRIESMDSKMRLYIQKVINNSEIKKGSRLYENGLSLSRAADMLNVSSWEMMSYVGKTSIIDKTPVYSTDVRKRILLTRKIFGSPPQSLVFDSGPIISLTMNHLMWTLDPLRKRLEGEFIISETVKTELVDRPLESKKFKFEALHTNRYLNKETLTLYPQDHFEKETEEILALCNSTFFSQGNPISIVHQGEIESIAIALKSDLKYLVIDERTTRLFIESPHTIEKILQAKIKRSITVDEKKLKKIRRLFSTLKVIRSAELATYAYESGLLDRYLPDRPYQRVTLLDAVLWGLKLNGCAISENEILDIIAFENHS